jgi:hypothetical protein
MVFFQHFFFLVEKIIPNKMKKQILNNNKNDVTKDIPGDI